jgi:hypothetical protein
MKRLFAVQIGVILLVAGGVVYSSGVYTAVQDNIVNVLCLSCIKLEPKTSANFTFQTATGASHPLFIRENLTTGPIVIMYSEDVCAACEEMYPVVQSLLNVTFEKHQMIYTHSLYQGTNVTFFFVNIDHTTQERRDTRKLYDKDHVDGLPMFTFITLRYDEGTVRPYYTSVYGTLGPSYPTPAEREAALAGILEDSVHLYHENRIGYEP